MREREQNVATIAVIHQEMQRMQNEFKEIEAAYQKRMKELDAQRKKLIEKLEASNKSLGFDFDIPVADDDKATTKTAE